MKYRIKWIWLSHTNYRGNLMTKNRKGTILRNHRKGTTLRNVYLLWTCGNVELNAFSKRSLRAAGDDILKIDFFRAMEASPSRLFEFLPYIYLATDIELSEYRFHFFLKVDIEFIELSEFQIEKWKHQISN